MRSGLFLGAEDFHEGMLGDGDLADLFHPLFSLLLLFPELSFPGNVAAVALGGDVFREGREGFSGDDFSADGGLDGDFKLLTGNDFLELFADGAPFGFGFAGMDEAGEGVDGLFVDLDFELDDGADLVFIEFVVKGAVPFGDRFEFVVEVGDDFVHGEAEGKEEAISSHRLGFFEDASLFCAEGHDGAEVVIGGHNVGDDPGLFDIFDSGGIWVVGRVIDLFILAVGEGHFIDDARGSGDDIEVELSLEALKGDF